MSFPWIALHRPEQLDEVLRFSIARPQIIFKHSTRCNISSLALRRLEQSGALPAADYYFLDLLAHRDISKDIAHRLDVWHESPQVLIVVDGLCVYDESHLAIDAEDINQHLEKK